MFQTLQNLTHRSQTVSGMILRMKEMIIDQLCTLKPGIRPKASILLQYLTNSRRTNLFIFARNQHVRRLLRTTYETGTQTRRIEIFCVSNNLYGEAQAEGRELEARIRRPGRRTTNATEQNQAIQAKLDGSGIDRLRDFCQDIPSRSQIAETRHFLNTRVLDLLQKVELWCNARDASEDRRQAPVELLRTLQAKLKSVRVLYLSISMRLNKIRILMPR
jgi:hypothetical protein